MLLSPALLLADETTSALDDGQKRVVENCFERKERDSHGGCHHNIGVVQAAMADQMLWRYLRAAWWVWQAGRGAGASEGSLYLAALFPPLPCEQKEEEEGR